MCRLCTVRLRGHDPGHKSSSPSSFFKPAGSAQELIHISYEQLSCLKQRFTSDDDIIRRRQPCMWRSWGHWNTPVGPAGVRLWVSLETTVMAIDARIITITCGVFPSQVLVKLARVGGANPYSGSLPLEGPPAWTGTHRTCFWHRATRIQPMWHISFDLVLLISSPLTSDMKEFHLRRCFFPEIKHSSDNCGNWSQLIILQVCVDEGTMKVSSSSV